MIRTVPQMPGWLPPLAPDERLLWHGRPDTTLLWPKRNLVTLLFGVMFAFSTMFFLGLSFAYRTTLLAMPVLAFGAFAAAFIGFPLWYDRNRRAHTRYALTTRAAITLRDGKTEHWPLSSEAKLENAPTGISFATERLPSRFGWYHAPVGFERLGADTARVQALVRQTAQQNATA